MPESCRLVFSRRRRVRRWAVTYVMSITLLSTTIVGLILNNGAKEKERDALSDQVEIHWLRNEEARGLLEQIRDLESSIARFNRLAWPVRVSDVIGVLEPVIPDSATLTSLTFVPREEKQPRVARGAKKGAKAGEPEVRTLLAIQIEGVARGDLDVARLVSALEDHALFSSVSLDFARSTDVDGVNARAFRLSCEIDLDKRYSFVDAVDGDGEVSP
jgi:hypothetical protein